MKVLQTSALPLGYVAAAPKRTRPRAAATRTPADGGEDGGGTAV